ncbi:hypothetical protein FSP39_015753, partial [Pinctada imbricata]
FQQVKVSVFNSSTEVAYLIFDAMWTDRFSWFNKSRLISTSYNMTHLMSQPFNFFSISGDATSSVVRRFLITRNYGGCVNDKGWILVSDGRNQIFSCNVDDVTTTTVYHSSLDIEQNFSKSSTSIGVMSTH